MYSLSEANHAYVMQVFVNKLFAMEYLSNISEPLVVNIREKNPQIIFFIPVLS